MTRAAPSGSSESGRGGQTCVGTMKAAWQVSGGTRGYPVAAGAKGERLSLGEGFT